MNTISAYCSLQTTALFSHQNNHNNKINSCKIPQPIIPRTLKLRCYSNGPSSGDNESRSVLDAFFLGKALAEAINERVESTVGEVLSTLGRLQAEQQKQVLDFQEEVMEKAKRAKEKAAREAMEAQGIVPKSAMKVSSPSSDGVVKSENNYGTINAGSTAESSPSPDSYKDVTATNPDDDDEEPYNTRVTSNE